MGNSLSFVVVIDHGFCLVVIPDLLMVCYCRLIQLVSVNNKIRLYNDLYELGMFLLLLSDNSLNW